MNRVGQLVLVVFVLVASGCEGGGGGEDQKPFIRITSPQDGDTVNDIIFVKCEAGQAHKFTWITLQAGEEFVSTGENVLSAEGTEVFTFYYPDGQLRLRAVGTVADGTEYSDSITVTVDNSVEQDLEPPTVSLSLFDQDPSMVSGEVVVLAQAQDNLGVREVRFFLDGTQAGADVEPPYEVTLDTRLTVNGDHFLDATAFDAAGNEGVAETLFINVYNEVVVEDPPPTLPILDLSGLWITERPGTQYVISPDIPPVKYVLALELEDAVTSDNGLAAVLSYSGSLEVTGYRNAGTNDEPVYVSCHRTYLMPPVVRPEWVSVVSSNIVHSYSAPDYSVDLHAEAQSPHSYPSAIVTVFERGNVSNYPAMIQALEKHAVPVVIDFETSLGLEWDESVPFCMGAWHAHAVGGSTYILRRVAGGPGQVNPLGRIEAQLRSSLPTDTDIEKAVHRGTLALYLQKGGPIRDRLPGETPVAYEEYLATQELELVNAMSIDRVAGGFTFDNPGQFIFNRVEALRSRSDGSARAVALYTVKVSGAQTDEIVYEDMQPTGEIRPLHFSPARIHNLYVNMDPVIKEIDPLTGMQGKAVVIERLKNVCPVNYGPPETQAEAFLEQLANSGNVTNENNEGINRAMWSERVVMSGSYLADELFTLSLSGLGTIMADLFDDLSDFTGARLTRAKQYKQHMEAARPSQRVRNFKAHDVPESSRKRLAEANRIVLKSEVAGGFSETIKALKPLTVMLLTEAGMDPNEASFIGDLAVFTMGSVLAGLKSGSWAGASKPAIKFIIEQAVSAGKPILMDGYDALLPFSFCGRRKPALQHSVDQMESWSSYDLSVYEQDQQKVVETIGRLSQHASDVLGQFRAELEVAKGFDAVQDGAAVIGRFVGWVKVVEKFAKYSKYGVNLRVFVRPLLEVHGTLADYVTQGVYEAFGQTAPKRRYRGDAGQPKGPGTRAIITLSPDSVVTALGQVVEAMQAGELGLAVERLYGDGEDSYALARRDWSWRVDVAMAQLWALEESYLMDNFAQVELLGALSSSRANLRVAEARLEHDLSTLFRQVLSAEYEDPDDPYYRAGQSVCQARVDRVIQDMQGLVSEIEEYVANRGTEGLRSLVAVEPLSLLSNATGEQIISQADEGFTLRARVANFGDAALSGLSARVTVTSGHDTVAIVGADVQALGTLEAGDGVDGSGGDEAMLEWQLAYAGAFDSENVSITVELLENDAAPESFETLPANWFLSLAAEVADPDLDFMPSSWETANGLDPATDDGSLDPDGDGVTSLNEFLRGTAPNLSDTDEDGLSDGEEISAGTDGFVTDPLAADTDGDQTSDLDDGQPLDPLTTAASPPPGEPQISVEPPTVRLTPEAPFAMVRISNAGEGILGWSAEVENPFVATCNPQSPDVRRPGGLFVNVPAGFQFMRDVELTTTITVYDALGGVKDSQQIEVIVACCTP